MSNYLTTDGLKKISILPEAPLRPEARGICHICHIVNPALAIAPPPRYGTRHALAKDTASLLALFVRATDNHFRRNQMSTRRPATCRPMPMSQTMLQTVCLSVINLRSVNRVALTGTVALVSFSAAQRHENMFSSGTFFVSHIHVQNRGRSHIPGKPGKVTYDYMCLKSK